MMDTRNLHDPPPSIKRSRPARRWRVLVAGWRDEPTWIPGAFFDNPEHFARLACPGTAAMVEEERHAPPGRSVLARLAAAGVP